MSACSSIRDVTTFTPQAANADRATVYIYRPNEMTNTLYSPGLTIDGEFKLHIKNGVNSRLTLAPGKHVFNFQNDNRYSEPNPLSLILDTGSIYFIRVNTSLKINESASYQPYARNFILTSVDERQAVKEIAVCCMANNERSANKEKPASTGDKTVDGFSVDKTQNPFSH